ncbi:MAG: PocR ligand-binding domain-containing protein, partial [Candidatus Eremiobacterota bacterium]
MEYKLSDLIDLSRLKNLIELFYKFSAVSTSIIDKDGNIIITTGCQDICSKFHLANPISFKECQETHNNIKAYL